MSTITNIGMAVLAVASSALATPPARGALPRPTPAADTTVAPSATPRAWVGLFHVTVTEPGRGPTFYRLLVEPNPTSVDALMINDAGESALTLVQVDSLHLVARMRTSEGPGTLSLELSSEGIKGTLKVGKHVLNVSGERAI